MPLIDRLRREIALTGPMTVADYVARCLHDPQDGYYATRPALGARGDFITAPLVSQMFGELIGLWAVEVWTRLGAPDRFRLVEVGPGDGTLMDDALRAARLAPAFLEACDLVLIEPSAPLARGSGPAPVRPRPPAALGEVPARRRDRRPGHPDRQRGAGLPARAPVRAHRRPAGPSGAWGWTTTAA